MSIALRADASRAVVVLDGVDRVAFNEDGSMELLTPTANPTGNKVMTVSQMPFSKEYVSPEQTITAGGLVTLAHTLGVMPRMWSYFYVCKTPEAGYSVGDLLMPAFTVDAGSGAGIYNHVVSVDITNIYARCATSGIATVNKSTGGLVVITVANWRLIVRAWA